VQESLIGTFHCVASDAWHEPGLPAADAVVANAAWAYNRSMQTRADMPTGRLPTAFNPLAATLLLFACANPNLLTRVSCGNLTQEEVDLISRHCGGRPGQAVVENAKLTLLISSNPTADFCIVEELEKTGQVSLPAVGVKAYLSPG
jgi:hypothetical protein